MAKSKVKLPKALYAGLVIATILQAFGHDLKQPPKGYHYELLIVKDSK